jgi:hypothetical protein
VSERTATIIQFPERPDPTELGGIADINAEMAPVELLDGTTTLKVPPDRVLEAAKGQLEDVLLLGWDKAGTMYVASSFESKNCGAELGHLTNLFLHKLYNGDYCL